MKPVTITHRGKTVTFATTLQEYQRRWCEALMLPGRSNLVESSLWEIQQRFPQRTAEEIRRVFDNSERLYAEDWNKQKIDARSERSVVNFYNSVGISIFNLMRWHAGVESGTSLGPLNYLITREVAEAYRWGRSYLDFGSGVGSSAILFAKAGWDVTLADVSEPLLTFARARLERRGLRAIYVDLKTTQLPDEQFDVATCFDVIEHTVKPLEVLASIRRALKVGGHLVMNIPYREDADRPMHIMHDGNLWKRFRGLGFDVDRWALPKAWAWVQGEAIYVLEKVERSALTNRAIGFYDARVPEVLKERLQWLKRVEPWLTKLR